MRTNQYTQYTEADLENLKRESPWLYLEIQKSRASKQFTAAKHHLRNLKKKVAKIKRIQAKTERMHRKVEELIKLF